MPLLLRVKNKTTIPVEVDNIRLEVVCGQSTDELRATLVQYGNRQVPLGEFFDVSGSAAEDETIVWEGDCSKVKLIGSEMQAGRMRVEGDAGMHLGAEMKGGEIVVTGNAGDWVGAEMKGGRIWVQGNTGHLAGAVYRGGQRGMTGGEIFIGGDTGNEVGHTMRRGLIAVAGKAGDAIGFGMLAGSIFVFGGVGIRPGAGMKRGTIGFLGTDPPPQMLPTFKCSGVHRPVFLRCYLLHLRRNGFAVPDECLTADYRRYRGDFLELGRGEILIRHTS